MTETAAAAALAGDGLPDAPVSCACCGGPAMPGATVIITKTVTGSTDGTRTASDRAWRLCSHCDGATEAQLVRSAYENHARAFSDAELLKAKAATAGFTRYDATPGARPTDAPESRWGHVSHVTRAHLLTRAFDASQPPQPLPHRSGVGCGLCGVRAAMSWTGRVINHRGQRFPVCGQCPDVDPAVEPMHIAAAALGIAPRTGLAALGFFEHEGSRRQPQGFKSRFGHLRSDRAAWAALRKAAGLGAE